MRSLSSAELLSIDAHLASCEECRTRILGPTRLQVAAGALNADIAAAGDETAHLTYPDLAAYVDGKMDAVEFEIAKSHLEACPECVAEINDLQAFSRQVSARGVTIDRSAPALTFLQWITSFAKSLSRRHLLQLAAAAACLALIAWAATVPLRTRISRLESELAEARLENERAQQDYEALKSHDEGLQAQVDSTQTAVTDSRNVAIVDGGFRVTLDSTGNIQGLESMPPAYQQMAAAALLTGRVKSPRDLEGLAGKAGTPLGEPDKGPSFALLSPVGTVVASDRPTFRWRALATAETYRVEIFDDNLEQVAASPSLAAAHWTAAKPIERGRVYSWQVTAIAGSREVKSPVPPAPQARFKVLGRAEGDELARARSKQPGSHLITGLLYAQAGLLDEAEHELQMLVRDNPDSASARKLLSSVRAMRKR